MPKAAKPKLRASDLGDDVRVPEASSRPLSEITGGPKPFAPKDRSAFLGSLDREIVRLKRAGHSA